LATSTPSVPVFELLREVLGLADDRHWSQDCKRPLESPTVIRSSPGLRQYCGRQTIIDVNVVDRHSTQQCETCAWRIADFLSILEFAMDTDLARR
jgi:hypothetical protein